MESTLPSCNTQQQQLAHISREQLVVAGLRRTTAMVCVLTLRAIPGLVAAVWPVGM
jgi:hypothetical protein